MATFKPKVVQSNGVDGLLDDTDHLKIAKAPSSNTHAANKKYVDDEVSAESTARTTADNTLQGNIDAEETARIAADGTLTTNLAQEVTDRTNADANLQSQIDGVDAIYVAVAGDNMTGALTIATDKIVLNTSGAATFAGALEAASVDGGSY